MISIHALRGESDRCLRTSASRLFYFNPRSPWGERLASLSIYANGLKFQSTLSVGRATPNYIDISRVSPISIHALRGESDLGYTGGDDGTGNISIHALRGESDFLARFSALFHNISIHALRGESDAGTLPPSSTGRYFNPRSPWGERQCIILSV